MHLTEFNAMDADTATSTVAVWAAVPAWASAIVAARPYASVDALVAHADGLARQWDAADLDAALAHHPRIGQRVAGASAEATHSRSEQSAMAVASDGIAADMAAANAAYEERFGRVFLIRAAGRSAEEMLAEARRRLGNDDPAESAEALTQLREIALLRLRSTVTEDDR
ncbi:2-oxo-4-hydroxy-4-carboxy-5-ureidoimidazoline decarboxylase [Microbacterium dauci]|uniref:2-oxo-4-hydroxy-4-carboxy-5-ureidoimidazoline decarboxylase n=1 Tax=Microbacterium dauci TaxID=3048008 RepID=A0ABT6ZCU6_9MICO|nr:2-oxo-4-hydroxy-4-carboxy-5-ureidoimidazoline decarboxylase [Microbacterium sp. LX3-4]MDJ1113977.1 2-oxo-4-hydroxy-4-carboxy-5-ureidoimidazoline decarboxylase [Microbacterium sp. LX3-4]